MLNKEELLKKTDDGRLIYQYYYKNLWLFRNNQDIFVTSKVNKWAYNSVKIYYDNNQWYFIDLANEKDAGDAIDFIILVERIKPDDICYKVNSVINMIIRDYERMLNQKPQKGQKKIVAKSGDQLILYSEAENKKLIKSIFKGKAQNISKYHTIHTVASAKIGGDVYLSSKYTNDVFIFMTFPFHDDFGILFCESFPGLLFWGKKPQNLIFGLDRLLKNRYYENNDNRDNVAIVNSFTMALLLSAMDIPVVTVLSNHYYSLEDVENRLCKEREDWEYVKDLIAIDFKNICIFNMEGCLNYNTLSKVFEDYEQISIQDSIFEEGNRHPLKFLESQEASELIFKEINKHLQKNIQN